MSRPRDEAEHARRKAIHAYIGSSLLYSLQGVWPVKDGVSTRTPPPAPEGMSAEQLELVRKRLDKGRLVPPKPTIDWRKAWALSGRKPKGQR